MQTEFAENMGPLDGILEDNAASEWLQSLCCALGGDWSLTWSCCEDDSGWSCSSESMMLCSCSKSVCLSFLLSNLIEISLIPFCGRDRAQL